MRILVASLALTVMLALDASAFNVFMAGDSHVCSDIYPETVGDILEEGDPEICFSFWGKIGAGFYTYNDTPAYMDYIFRAEPDVLIVHLGTNDSYTPRFSRAKYLADMETFYCRVKQRLPQCKIVFITPFYNHLKGKLNRSTRACADATLDFADGHADAYVVDNNATHGMHFLNGGDRLIRHDGVHLTAAGYRELGIQVAAALIDIQELWNS